MCERIVRAVAGIIVLTSITLAVLVSIKWLLLTAFVGLNLLQSSFTKFCPLEKMLKACKPAPKALAS
ncbi:MAG: YgaP family membrane protein [Parafilimonas sp.]